MKSTIKQRLVDSDTDFNNIMEDEVLLSNDPDIFNLALDRQDCPKTIIVDLSQTPHDAVRLKIANHPSTPVPTLRKLASDSNSEVASIANRRLKNGQ